MILISFLAEMASFFRCEDDALARLCFPLLVSSAV
jgi:hypothetical protein